MPNFGYSSFPALFFLILGLNYSAIKRMGDFMLKITLLPTKLKKKEENGTPYSL